MASDPHKHNEEDQQADKWAKGGQNGRHMDAIWETNSDNQTKSPSTTAKLQANRNKRKTKAETKRKTTQTRPPKLGDN